MSARTAKWPDELHTSRHIRTTLTDLHTSAEYVTILKDTSELCNKITSRAYTLIDNGALDGVEEAFDLVDEQSKICNVITLPQSKSSFADLADDNFFTLDDLPEVPRTTFPEVGTDHPTRTAKTAVAAVIAQ